jgi:YaiO family outer membrane protein
MSPKYFWLCVVLLSANVWAVDKATPPAATTTPVTVTVPVVTPAPVPGTAADIPPEIIDVELPAAFTAAQPIPLPVPDAAPPEPSKPPADILPYQVEAGSSYSRLSNGYADWSSFYVNAEMKLASRNNIYLMARKENRYVKSDTEIMGGFYEPIDDHFTAVVEGSVSPEHNFLASRSLLGEIEYNGANGWAGEIGLGHTEYNITLVNLLTFNVERSWGNYRVAYTRFQSFLPGNGTANSNQVQAAKYYGDRNWYGVTISDGNELEALSTKQILSSHVRTLVFSGLHWLKPTLGLTYTLGNFHQGNFYTRNGIQFGLRQQF